MAANKTKKKTTTNVREFDELWSKQVVWPDAHAPLDQLDAFDHELVVEMVCSIEKIELDIAQWKAQIERHEREDMMQLAHPVAPWVVSFLKNEPMSNMLRSLNVVVTEHEIQMGGRMAPGLWVDAMRAGGQDRPADGTIPWSDATLELLKQYREGGPTWKEAHTPEQYRALRAMAARSYAVVDVVQRDAAIALWQVHQKEAKEFPKLLDRRDRLVRTLTYTLWRIDWIDAPPPGSKEGYKRQYPKYDLRPGDHIDEHGVIQRAPRMVEAPESESGPREALADAVAAARERPRRPPRL